MKANFGRLLTIAVLAWSVISCSSTPEEEIIEPASLESFKPEIDTEVLWKRSVIDSNRQEVGFAPYIHDNKIFVSSEIGRVVAYDIESGKPLWTKEYKVPISSPIGGFGDRIMFGTKDADILTVRQSDGQLLWREKLSSEILSKPLLDQNIAVVRTIDGKLFGINTESGQSLWTYERKVPALSLHGTSAPIVAGRNVYAGFDNGKLIAFTLQDGKVVWEMTLAVPSGRSELERMVDVDADPIISENVLFAVSYQGRIAAVDRYTGSLIWSRELSSYTGLSLDAHNIYVSDDKGFVWALYRNSGATFWKQDKLKARRLSAPAVHGEYIVVGDYEGYLHWLSREDGRIVARTRIDDSGITAAPVIKKDTLLARSQSGVVAAIDIKPLSAKNKKNRSSIIDTEIDEDF